MTDLELFAEIFSSSAPAEIAIIGIPCNGVINRQRIEMEIGEKEILEVFALGNNIVVKGKDFEKEFPFDEYINELC